MPSRTRRPATSSSRRTPSRATRPLPALSAAAARRLRARTGPDGRARNGGDRERASNPLLAVGGEEAFVAALLGSLASYPAHFDRLGELNRRGPGVLEADPALPALPAARVAQLLADESSHDAQLEPGEFVDDQPGGPYGLVGYAEQVVARVPDQ